MLPWPWLACITTTHASLPRRHFARSEAGLSTSWVLYCRSLRTPLFILLQLSHAPSFCILVVSPLNPLHIFPSLVYPGLTSSIDLFRPVCVRILLLSGGILLFISISPPKFLGACLCPVHQGCLRLAVIIRTAPFAEFFRLSCILSLTKIIGAYECK
ncbi:hypothetical protein LB507_002192 [Fusarium sp. FIESC RH6]|nr:hypothetical protein LB507_002192 [Fusarium sp. FIESC RH6]